MSNHLATNMSIAAMVFYSILTFFIAPSITRIHLADKFEDPTRRTPNIDKIIKATGIKPSYDIKTMIKEIVEFKNKIK